MTRVRKAISWLLLITLAVIGCAALAMAGIYLFMRTLIWSQASTVEDYVPTCESAATRLPIAVEVEKLFPGKTDHFITHYGFNRYGGDRTNTWNSEAYFYGRYSLTMQIEVVVDYKNNTVTPAGEPKFYLVEYSRVDDNGGGVYSAFSGGGATFGEKEWQEIYHKGGDFSVVHLSVRKDAPVPNMAEYVQAMRRPRIRVSLLNKNPMADENRKHESKK